MGQGRSKGHKPDRLQSMSALVRCPQCDTFIKPASIDSGSCPFCPSSNARSKRNAIPGLVLAASLSIAPACSGSSAEPEAAPVPNVIVDDSDTDKKEAPVPDAGVTREVLEPIPAAVYGGAAMYDPVPEPDHEPPPLPTPSPDKK